MELLVWGKWLLICVVATEASTEIIVDSKLFDGFHHFVRQRAYPPDAPPPTGARLWWKWLDDLTSCGYCTSVWMAGLFVTLLPGYHQIHWRGWWHLPGEILVWIGYVPPAWFAQKLLVHRLSNWLHVAYQLVRRGRVRTYDHTVRLEEQDYVGV